MKHYFAKKRNNFFTKMMRIFFLIALCFLLFFILFPLSVSVSVFEEDTLYSWYQIAVTDFHNDEQPM